MKIYLLLLFSLVSCNVGQTTSSVGFTEDLATIDGSTVIIDNGLAWAIENDSSSNLKPLFKETSKIRSKTKGLRVRFTQLIQEREDFKKKIEEDKKLIWLDVAYRVAPLVLGAIILLIGRFLTQDPADTKFGIVCFLSGIGINAFYDTIGNWGIVVMLAVGLGWYFYSYEKKDLAKKQRATNIDQPNIN